MSGQSPILLLQGLSWGLCVVQSPILEDPDRLTTSCHQTPNQTEPWCFSGENDQSKLLTGILSTYNAHLLH